MSSSAALSSLLALVDGPPTAAVAYVVGGTTLTGEPRELAAALLADDAMTIACGKSPTLDYWRARRDGGQPETGSRLESIKTYVRIGFGLPGRPLNADHLQGHVAELLWNRLVQERLVCHDGRQLVRAHSVKIDPLEPGGDGLVVYEDTRNTLVFRLWEIKKHDVKRGVAATINKASKQLAARGHEYLAKLAGPETLGDDSALTDLYANMVELWFDRSERAGVGVSIGTSADRAPTQPRSFKSIRTAFPDFTEVGQKECIVVAVPDFPAFAERVKEIVWSGL